MTPIAPLHGTSCRDWRLAAAGDIVPLIDAEVRAWRHTLSWDIAEPWRVIDPARQAGRLPGLIAIGDDGRPAGWTAFLPHEGFLQVMALAGRDEAAITTLVDGILDSAEARTCDATVVCVREDNPILRTVLTGRGFAVEPYRYLMRDLTTWSAGDVQGRTATTAAIVPGRWRDHDAAMAALCARAYRGDATTIRGFAPGGTSAEWRHYVSTLVQGTGCGWFLPELSFVMPRESEASGAATPPASAPLLDACLMLTDLGTGVAHIAQLAVDPAARGQGRARLLVQTALTEASCLHTGMSLLVASSNTVAATLYESLGFRDHASFIVARA